MLFFTKSTYRQNKPVHSIVIYSMSNEMRNISASLTILFFYVKHYLCYIYSMLYFQLIRNIRYIFAMYQLRNLIDIVILTKKCKRESWLCELHIFYIRKQFFYKIHTYTLFIHKMGWGSKECWSLWLVFETCSLYEYQGQIVVIYTLII